MDSEGKTKGKKEESEILRNDELQTERIKIKMEFKLRKITGRILAESAV